MRPVRTQLQAAQRARRARGRRATDCVFGPGAGLSQVLLLVTELVQSAYLICKKDMVVAHATVVESERSAIATTAVVVQGNVVDVGACNIPIVLCQRQVRDSCIPCDGQHQCQQHPGTATIVVCTTYSCIRFSQQCAMHINTRARLGMG